MPNQTPVRNPIATNHPSYEAAKKKWKRCRDACSGSDAIKAAGTEYLPALGSHRGVNGAEKYESYKKRALWYNASRRTRIGLSGAATMRPPKVVANSEKSKAAAERCKAIARAVVDEQLEVGRIALLVNKDGSDAPTVSTWWAESIVNWRFKRGPDGSSRLTLLVLEEKKDVEIDDFRSKQVLVRHAYRLQPAGLEFVCEYSRWAAEEGKDWLEEIGWRPVTRVGGAPIDHIPARIIGSMSLDEDEVEDPLLLDLVDVNISHYQNSADLEHGRHWTALPTAVATGFPTHDKDGNPLEFAVGGENAWVSDAPGASAHYLEFSGAGLGHISEGMKEKQSMMAVLGARLLEEAKPSVESAETFKTRLTGEKSVLSRVTKTSSDGLTWAQREQIAMDDPTYRPVEGEDLIELQNDFMRPGMSPGELSALTGALQAGGISYQTYFQKLQMAEIIPDERTVEEETALIDAGNPGPKPDGGAAFGNDGDGAQ